jgi:hypothetical protein
MRVEPREDCIALLCECGNCELPVAMLRRGRNGGLRIESKHQGQKHTNLISAENLVWAYLYLSGQEDSIICEGLQLSSHPELSRR